MSMRSVDVQGCVFVLKVQHDRISRLKSTAENQSKMRQKKKRKKDRKEREQRLCNVSQEK